MRTQRSEIGLRSVKRVLGRLTDLTHSTAKKTSGLRPGAYDINHHQPPHERLSNLHHNTHPILNPSLDLAAISYVNQNNKNDRKLLTSHLVGNRLIENLRISKNGQEKSKQKQKTTGRRG
jgi:hypothetical protein